jgi:multisubunit Na+/H+ antiporter MnhE subunit
MSRFQAALILLWRFASALLLSAWTTSVIILSAGDAPRRGFARLDYEDLDEAGVMLLAAMVTLTPGSSTVDIDTERRELLLHVLDTEDIDSTLSDIKLKFLHPIRMLFGGQS